MNRALTFTVVLLAAGSLRPPCAAAQSANALSADAGNLQAPAAGWSFTPTLSYAGGWDDNVLVTGNGDPSNRHDFVSIMNPRGAIDFTGRRTQLSGAYDGSFLIYRDLQSLNSFEQHGALSVRRLVSPHVSVFARNSAASVPTTELLELVGVPFVRVGSRLDDFRTGVEAALTARTSATAAYNFQWVDFDQSRPGSVLLGGHSHGTTVAVRHRLSNRTAITSDYDWQHATVGADAQRFDVQNASAGLDYKLSDTMHVFAAGGVSRLALTGLSDVRTGPAARLGFGRRFRAFDAAVTYNRSFVPSYGFNGTTQNEELTGRMRLQLARRMYAASSVSWRRNDPLIEGGLPLRSLWIEGTFGYALAPWLRAEVFYGATHQTIDRPGGTTDRNRVEFRIITTKPMRIR
jgi:hypothetical protein